MKLINVYGVMMCELDSMLFSKYLANNNIAMNTKLADERKAIAEKWLENKNRKH